MTPFIDRNQERQELAQLAQAGDRRLAILYGRRRIGKTFLLSHAWGDETRLFYFLAADATAALNRAELSRDLTLFLRRPLAVEDYPTWRTVFRLFAELAADAALVVVLDEFQYLLGGEDDAASQLAAVWDREAVGKPLTMVLSGSEVSAMAGLLGGGQPLFGRASWSARLRPFDYYDAALMLPGRPPREQALLYGVFGGTPRYLEVVQLGEPPGEAITRTMLSPRGEISLQIQTLIEQEKGIRDSALYRSVLVAVARGHTLANEIAQQAGVADQRTVRRALEVLEDLAVISRERNFAAHEKTPWRFRIADPAVRFWYRFVHPNRGRLETGHPAEVWTALVEPFLDDYMGKVFEQIVEQAFRRHHAAWGLPMADAWARWEGKDRLGRSIELDVVAALSSNLILAGEVKWSSSPIGARVHYDLEHDLEALARSGQGWANQASAPDAPRLYVSAASFDQELARLAREQPRIRLVDLEALYASPSVA